MEGREKDIEAVLREETGTEAMTLAIQSLEHKLHNDLTERELMRVDDKLVEESYYHYIPIKEKKQALE